MSVSYNRRVMTSRTRMVSSATGVEGPPSNKVHPHPTLDPTYKLWGFRLYVTSIIASSA